MKNLIITSISTLIIAVLFIQPSIAQDHSSHSHESEEVKQYNDVPDEFRASLTKAVEAYIVGKDALLESDLEASIAGFNEFTSQLETIGEHGLSGDGHVAWMESYNQLIEHTTLLLNSDNINSVRQVFQTLSIELAGAVKKFGIEGVVYQQYCPMALNSDGATWLSRNEQIQNPYSPNTMLGCGRVVERIES